MHTWVHKHWGQLDHFARFLVLLLPALLCGVVAAVIAQSYALSARDALLLMGGFVVLLSVGGPLLIFVPRVLRTEEAEVS